MLKSVSLTNFRKVENDTREFTEGLNVIRGANESSKTTRLEAIAYALFGSRALRDSLEDVVTWGHPVRDLKVVLEYGDYTIARSKGGAEVSAMGQVLVTGQTEVTKFCEANILGCDSATATNLMFANQTELRGVLTSGPKATATMIETLGDFDLFDRILDAAQNQLSLGSSAVQDDRLRNLVAQREAMIVPEAPDMAAFEAAIAAAVCDRAAAESSVSTMGSRLEELDGQYQTELGRMVERDNLKVQLRQVQGQLSDTRNEMGNYAVVPAVRDTKPHEDLIANAEQGAARREAYGRFCQLPAVEHHDRAVIRDQVERVETRLREVRVEISESRQAYRVAEAKLVTSSTCGFCGQDVSQFPAVAEQNERLASEMAQAKEGEALAEAEVLALEAEGSRYAALAESEKAILNAIRGIEQYLGRDDTDLPTRISWLGDPPCEAPVALAELKQELAEIKANNEHALKIQGKVEVLSKQLETLAGRERDINAQIDAVQIMPEAKLKALALEISQLRAKIDEQLGIIQTSRTKQAELQQEMDRVSLAYGAAVKARDDLTARIADTEKEIQTLAFNNQLVKKIRAARPIVGNKLWTMVLATVSTIFSQMRGVTSVVSKGSDGFLVNGAAVSSLSGSTLDLLGLAVRCALVKTFIPACSMLVLDEPGSGCDQNRMQSLLGYIAAAGFKQVLLVTHDSVSDSFADQLIEL